MIIANKTHTAKEDKDCWATPFDVFHSIERLIERQFYLDACASSENKKCQYFITAEQDCLKTDWGSPTNVWINPPYSNPLPFVQRAIEQCVEKGHFVVMLLPADTSVRWFSLCQQYARLIVFITEGRISFIHNSTGKATRGNSKGSMIVVFDPQKPYGIHCETSYITLAKLIGKVKQNKEPLA